MKNPSAELTPQALVAPGNPSPIYEQRVYANGAKHVYAVDAETGKHTHLSHANILADYGHAGEEQGLALENTPRLQEKIAKLQADFMAAEGSHNTIAMEKAKKALDTINGRLKPLESVTEPVDKLSVPSLRERMTNIFQRGHRALKSAVSLYGNRRPEKQKDQRRSMAAIGLTLIGVLTVGGVAVENRSTESTARGERIETLAMPHTGLASEATNREVASNTSAISTQISGGHEIVLNSAMEKLSHEGDTIWRHAEDRLASKGGAHPTPKEVRAETERILKLNGISWEQAHDLPVDFAFRV